MEYLIYIFILILWMMFWSFSSVIISRIKNWKWWIINWRSECPKCKHKLWAKDLIPLFSYLSTWWRCRYCKEKISHLYPILEVFMWLIFFLVSYILVDINSIIYWNNIELLKLGFYLLLAFLTVIFVVYDILYLEIPDSIMIIAISLTIWVLSIQTLYTNNILFTIPSNTLLIEQTINYYAIILWLVIISLLYVIMLVWLNEIIDIIILLLTVIWLYYFWIYFNTDIKNIPILNWIIWALAIFIFFFTQIIISKWKWMWWWDLRIAILIWLILGVSYSFAWIMIAYILWSIIWILFIIYKKSELKKKEKKNILNKIKKHIWFKVKKTSIDTEIPFWPFLAIWLFLMLFYWEIIISNFNKYLWQ